MAGRVGGQAGRDYIAGSQKGLVEMTEYSVCKVHTFR